MTDTVCRWFRFVLSPHRFANMDLKYKWRVWWTFEGSADFPFHHFLELIKQEVVHVGLSLGHDVARSLQFICIGKWQLIKGLMWGLACCEDHSWTLQRPSTPLSEHDRNGERMVQRGAGHRTECLLLGKCDGHIKQFADTPVQTF